MLDEWLWTADGCSDDSWDHRINPDCLHKSHKKVTALWSRNAVTFFVTNFRNWPSIGSIPFCTFIVADSHAFVKRCGAFALFFAFHSRKIVVSCHRVKNRIFLWYNSVYAFALVGTVFCRSNRKQSGKLTGKERKIWNPICSASGALSGEWPARSGRWNDVWEKGWSMALFRFSFLKVWIGIFVWQYTVGRDKKACFTQFYRW